MRLKWAEKTVALMTDEENCLRNVIMICTKEGPLVPEPIIKAILEIFRFTSTTHRLLRYILWFECAVKTADPTTLLRDNNLANKLVIQIGLHAFQPVLVEIKKVIQMLEKAKPDLEVIEAKIKMRKLSLPTVPASETPPSKSKRLSVARRSSVNAGSLKYWSNNFLGAVLEAKLPEKFKEWMRMVYHAVVKCRVSPDSQLSFLSSFIFCRLVCPTLVKSKTSDRRFKRNLILVSKVLQKVANGVSFDSRKEKAFLPLSQWSNMSIKRIQRFVETVVGKPVVPPPPPSREKSHLTSNISQSIPEYNANKEDIKAEIPPPPPPRRKSVKNVSVSPPPRVSYSLRRPKHRIDKEQRYKRAHPRPRRQRSNSQPSLGSLDLQKWWTKSSSIDLPEYTPSPPRGRKKYLPPEVKYIEVYNEKKHTEEKNELVKDNKKKKYLGEYSKSSCTENAYMQMRPVKERTKPPRPKIKIRAPRTNGTLTSVSSIRGVVESRNSSTATDHSHFHESAVISPIGSFRERIASPSSPKSQPSDSKEATQDLRALLSGKSNYGQRVDRKQKETGLYTHISVSTTSTRTSRRTTLRRHEVVWLDKIPNEIRKQASALAQYLRFVAEIQHPDLKVHRINDSASANAHATRSSRVATIGASGRSESEIEVIRVRSQSSYRRGRCNDLC